MAISIDLGFEQFKTKKACEQHFKKMLDNWSSGNLITREHREFDQLLCLIERHENVDEKIGVGVHGFYVNQSPPPHNTNCFYLCRHDYSETDFSTKRCINGPPSKKSLVHSALREVVRETIQREKVRWFDENKTKDNVIKIDREDFKFEDIHADHRSPMTFEAIAVTFLVKMNLSLEAVDIEDSRDNNSIRKLSDRELREKFLIWHNKLAQIFIVPKSFNLSQGPKHRMKVSKIDEPYQLQLK